MAFVDEVTLHLKAGDGGDGIIAWLHEKGREFMGPAGGDGGKGGDVFLRAVSDIARLLSYRYGNTFSAGRGGTGQGKNRHGKGGADLELSVPVGSVIKSEATGRTRELLAEGERVLLLRGGRGGFGNAHFKSSRNVRPRESTLGKAGERGDFRVELRLIADAGLVGLPNAGKSSLLNALTSAHAKVAPYAFTTLEPNLGALNGAILADIPGLISGASAGRGLGIKFLKHIARTKLLVHCISLEQEDPAGVYDIVRKELEAFSPELSKKPEFIALTKTDAVPEAAVEKAEAALTGKKRRILTVSVIDDARLKQFKAELLHILKPIP